MELPGLFSEEVTPFYPLTENVQEILLLTTSLPFIVVGLIFILGGI